MMPWSKRHTLLAGLALILATNVIALAGVALNRSGEPTSLVQLSERELQLYNRSSNKENSGVTLSLRWRVDGGDDASDSYYIYGVNSSPSWLDEAKMAALGFGLPPGQKTERWINRQQTREVLLVLEQDGPAYQKSLERARQKAHDDESLSMANPGNKEFKDRADYARKNLQHETTENSRLFVIDAGLDSDALRAKYPDKTRYIIARGKIRPSSIWHNEQRRFGAYVSALSISQINVPVGFQDALKHDEQKSAPFEASVAYGKRLEPWIVVLTARAAK